MTREIVHQFTCDRCRRVATVDEGPPPRWRLFSSAPIAIDAEVTQTWDLCDGCAYQVVHFLEAPTEPDVHGDRLRVA